MKWIRRHPLTVLALSFSPLATAGDIDVWKTDIATAIYIETHIDLPNNCHLSAYTRYYQGWTLNRALQPGDIPGKSVHGFYLAGGDKQIHFGEPNPHPPTDQGCNLIWVMFDPGSHKIRAECDFSFTQPKCPE
jgi:hypothetical protein